MIKKIRYNWNDNWKRIEDDKFKFMVEVKTITQVRWNG